MRALILCHFYRCLLILNTGTDRLHALPTAPTNSCGRAGNWPPTPWLGTFSTHRHFWPHPALLLLFWALPSVLTANSASVPYCKLYKLSLRYASEEVKSPVCLWGMGVQPVLHWESHLSSVTDVKGEEQGWSGFGFFLRWTEQLNQ